jgi:hypothetical protein
MSDKKNLDHLFQEKLQNFEQEPKPDVWGQIQNKMQQKKKRRVAAWWWYAAAAIIALGLFVFWPDGPSSDQFRTDPVLTKSPKNEDLKTNPLENNKNNDVKNTLQNTAPIQENEPLITEKVREEIGPKKTQSPLPKSTISKEAIAQTLPEKEKRFKSDKIAVQQQEDVKDKKDLVNLLENKGDKRQEKPDVEMLKKADSTQIIPITQKKKALVAQIDEDILEDTSRKKKWSLRPLVAFSTMLNSANSPAGNSFADNATSGNTSLNYGLSVAYEVNDKLILQTGVMTQNVSFNTQDVLLIQQDNVSTASSDIGFRDGISYNVSIADQNAELNQVIRYVEIPVEAKYRITKSNKIRSYVIGGFSSLFLQNDDVILLSDVVGASELGNANNLNTLNFSGNFGLDLDYQINNNLFFNINPMVKVHLNTFARNSNGYRPYFVGVYSGIKYQF